MAVLARGFSGKTLASDEGTLFADKSFEFAAVTAVEAVFAAFVAALELALALLEVTPAPPVFVQQDDPGEVGLVFGTGSYRRGRDRHGRRGFDHGDGEESHAGAGVEDEENGADGYEEAEAKG